MDLTYELPPIIGSGLAAVLIIIVTVGGRKKPAQKVFTLILFASLAWGLLIYLMRTSSSADQALFWDRATVPVIFATYVLYYHFSLVLTRSKTNSPVLWSVYVTLAIVTAISPTGLFIQDMSRESYGWAPVIGPLVYVLFPLGPILTIISVRKLYSTAKHTSRYTEKNSLLWIAAGMVLSFTSTIPELFPQIFPTSILGNIAFCSIATIAIIKYHLFDIQIVLRKGMAYVLLSGLVAIPYVLIIFLISIILDPGISSMWVYLLILLLLAITVQPLWRLVQRLVDRLYYRERYDYLTTLKKFGRECADIIKIEDLSSRLVSLTRSAMQTSVVHLLIYDEKKDRLQITSSAPAANLNDLYLDADSEVVKWLKDNDKPVYVEDIAFDGFLGAIAGRELAMLSDLDATLLVPFRHASKMVGILILGPKLSEEPYGPDDLSILSVVANHASSAIENANLYAQAVRTERALQLKTSELEQIIYATSHDLRSPLLNVQGFSRELEKSLKDINDLIQRSSIDPMVRERLAESTSEDINTALHFIIASTSKMDGLLSGLLQISRLGRKPIEIEEIDMNDLVGLIVKSNRYRLRDSNITLTVEELPTCFGDRNQLDQVFSNLIDNAIKFRDPAREGIVKISGWRQADEAIYCVEDNGIGIAADYQQKVFDIFHQLEPHTSDGDGLGLAIVKRIVERHSGNVRVESEPCKGSSFFVTLPTTHYRTYLERSPVSLS